MNNERYKIKFLKVLFYNIFTYNSQVILLNNYLDRIEITLTASGKNFRWFIIYEVGIIKTLGSTL